MKLPSGGELQLLQLICCTQHGGPKAEEEPRHCVIGIALEEEKGTETNYRGLLKASNAC